MERAQEQETTIRVVQIQIQGETRADVVQAYEELRQTHRLITAHEPQWRKSMWTITAELLIAAQP